MPAKIQTPHRVADEDQLHVALKPVTDLFVH